jgi:hypothetical protein
MLTNWPQSNQDDLPRFVEYLESQLIEDEQIVRITYINKSTLKYISIEPSGTGVDFPAGSQYEVVALVPKNTPNLSIEFRETGVVIWTSGAAAVFYNGVATFAYQDTILRDNH